MSSCALSIATRCAWMLRKLSVISRVVACPKTPGAIPPAAYLTRVGRLVVAMRAGVQVRLLAIRTAWPVGTLAQEAPWL